MSQFLGNFDLSKLLEQDKEEFADNEGESSDALSTMSSTELDLDPFQSDQEPDSCLGRDPGRFSVQGLLPLEVVEMIAIRISDDSDLKSFILSCKDFAAATVLRESTIWRVRFLQSYDHPIIEGPYEFRIAYQLREMVLRKFPSFAGRDVVRSRVALEVLRDMVLETYHNPRKINGCPSRNMGILSSPRTAPHMHKFLSSPFFAYGTHPYGQSNELFDVLQIVFSHLLLHPVSQFTDSDGEGPFVEASRDNYDLTIIYLYKTPLTTIYHQKPNLDGTQFVEESMAVDFYALLHIRNFWHGHLASAVNSKYASDNGVTTYGNMARELNGRSHAPQEWQGPIGRLSPISSHWYGHYSCSHSTPRNIIDIEEHHTCAEDWIHQFGDEGVHALTLDIATTASQQLGWWSPIFSTMPKLESTIPPVSPTSGHVFIRGIAPFLSPLRHPDMYPAYTALRVRGIIHPLPDQEEIPGWRRIVLVLYKPTSRYMLAVLDENSPPDDKDDYDDIDFTQLQPPPQQQITFPIPPNLPPGGGGAGGPQDAGTDLAQPQQVPVPFIPTTVQVDNAPESEEAMKADLESRDELKGPLGPTRLTRDFIAHMEDNLHPPEELAWEDISYAYVYEGVVIPGGKVMMGRHWRFGAPSAVDGFELGDGADRGPWVFWC